MTIVAVGIAALSSLTESWTLHDVHEPQSAKALITTSQRPISSGKQSASVRLILRSATSSISPLSPLEQITDKLQKLIGIGFVVVEQADAQSAQGIVLAPGQTGLFARADSYRIDDLDRCPAHGMPPDWPRRNYEPVVIQRIFNMRSMGTRARAASSGATVIS